MIIAVMIVIIILLVLVITVVVLVVMIIVMISCRGEQDDFQAGRGAQLERGSGGSFHEPDPPHALCILTITIV